MARTEITAIQVPGSYAADTNAFTWTTADTSNKNSVALNGNQIILAHNGGASPVNVTVTSVATPTYGRTQDDVFAIPAGEWHVLPRYLNNGWRQSADNMLYFEAATTDIEFAILKLA